MADIFIDHKLVFMHNPKCGSRNLRQVAMQLVARNPSDYIGGMNYNRLLFVNRKVQARRVNHKVSESIPRFENYTWEHCNVYGIYRLFHKFKINPEGFTFLYIIRHPQHRYFSGYRYDRKRQFIDADTSFSDYIHNNGRMKNATQLNKFQIERFSMGPKRTPHLHQIIRLEHFEDDLTTFFQSRGFRTNGIKFNLRPHSSGDFVLQEKMSFSSEDMQFISQHWKEDIRLGGYELDPNMEL